jgi:adenylate kinase
LDGILGITGTPGTGKKSVAPLVAKILGVRAYGLNDLALSLGLVESTEDGNVETDLLRRKVVGKVKGPAVVYGHLVPYVLDRESVSKVAVLRCEPGVLKERLSSRGYTAKKVQDNVEGELIGLVSSDAFDTFWESSTFEIDTTFSGPKEAAEAIAAVVGGEAPPDTRIDWTTNYDSGLKLRSLLSIA